MEYSEAKQGRTFVLRLHDGEVLHEQIEALARKEKVLRGFCVVVGGAKQGSRLVVGPRDGSAVPVDPMKSTLERVHEVAGVGTIFPAPDGKPALHMHMACGRDLSTVTGCVREGVVTWQILEVIVQELTDSPAVRKKDATLGFALLAPLG